MLTKLRRSVKYTRLSLFSLLLTIAAFGILFNHSPFSTKRIGWFLLKHETREQEYKISKLLLHTDFEPVLKKLLKLVDIPVNCQKNKKCISFGTPLFNTYANWETEINVRWKKAAYCPYTCPVIANVSQAHAVLFHGRDLVSYKEFNRSKKYKRQDFQSYIYFNWESPIATKESGYDVSSDSDYRHFFNWTATFKRSSDIYVPYARIEKHPSANPTYVPALKKHFMFVVISNCKAFNHRMETIKEMQKFMNIRVFGECGDPFPKNATFQSLSEEYRFYLSFENSYCIDYITEKYFLNGLLRSAMPVVMGGTSISEYSAISPPKSFIYGPNFKTIKQLAEFLTNLAADEKEYASYLAWKAEYKISDRDKGDDIYCQVCSKLQTTGDQSRHTTDLAEYYDITTQCFPSTYKPFS